MKNTYPLIFILFFSLLSFTSIAQPANDLALNHNRLLREKTGEGVYKQIGNYKVQGTSYLFSEKNKGHIYSPAEKAQNIFLSYNTYNQELEFYSTSNPDKALIKAPGELDSFILLPNSELGIASPLKFVYGDEIGSKENVYFQEVFAGPKFSVYKKYHSELGYVSANYIQPDLRQFDLLLDYYYSDADKKLKKIKPNSVNVIKEFKGIKDLSEVADADEFSTNPEAAFRKVFEYLNR